ncbi:AMP-binding protein [Massilia niastensis]|uniref:AMP-binding protein n=1 Tax=Massilia niastensis TaxID=544911 RepID=UPI000382033F|nr:AMP-binding protein [Massilia niastensis]
MHDLDRAGLARRIERVGTALLARRQPRAPVAILADNSPEWLAIDLAAQALDICLVPLPLFFTPAQWMHVIVGSGVQAIFCADPEQAARLGFGGVIDCAGPLALCEAPRAGSIVLPEGTRKITFTSGTTSAPKGVCLGSSQQWEVAQALHEALAPLGIERHLSLLPFAVLLENIAGAYTALLSGATVICPPLAETGVRGASDFDPGTCLAAIARYRAESIILVPQMLQALVAATVPHDPRIASLRFVAVGGARVSARLLASARERGFPVYEGYGLSECASVVALNLPGAERAGSVGRPLAQRQVRIAADGEILVAGQAARYLGQAPEAGPAWLATGDLGHLDRDGFLHVEGRKKDVLITAYGRNVSPEWPEAALAGTGALAQALVVGEAQPYLAALVVPSAPGVGPDRIQQAVDAVNADLPDYARVRRWIAVPPFTTANGLATANGRPRRAAILDHHASDIASLFDLPESIT